VLDDEEPDAAAPYEYDNDQNGDEFPAAMR
jgi:hypothetical protein